MKELASSEQRARTCVEDSEDTHSGALFDVAVLLYTCPGLGVCLLTAHSTLLFHSGRTLGLNQP